MNESVMIWASGNYFSGYAWEQSYGQQGSRDI